MSYSIADTAPRAEAFYAGFWVRLLAVLVDGVVIGVLLTLVTLGQPLPVTGQGMAGVAGWHNGLETLVGFVYFTVCWSWLAGGQTVGMLVFGLHVVDASGAPIGLLSAVVRWIGVVLSAAVVLLGLVWIAFDPRKQGWHDKLAGSFVVGSRS